MSNPLLCANAKHFFMKFLLLLFCFLVLGTAASAFFRHKSSMNQEQKETVVDPASHPRIVSWAHLEGTHFDEAHKAILQDRPELRVVKLPKNAMVTMDFRQDRVRVFVDENNKVVGRPIIG